MEEWAGRLRVTPKRVVIRSMEGKWGSCSTRGTVTLSASLLRRPREFRDYVIVHELLHLRVANHGRLMKTYLSIYCPGWERYDPGLARSRADRLDVRNGRARARPISI